MWLIIFSLLHVAYAETTERIESRIPVPANIQIEKRWSSNLSVNELQLEGALPAKQNLYSVHGVHVSTRTLSGTYAMGDGWSLNATALHIENNSEVAVRGQIYKANTNGFGDTNLILSKIGKLSDQDNLILEGGLSVPTGSTNKTNPSHSHYIYILQLGSGTWDLPFAITYTHAQSQWAHGARVQSVIRTGEQNSEGYRLGTQSLALAWTEYHLSQYFVPLLRATYLLKESIHGADRTIARGPLTEFYYHDQVNWDVTFAVKSHVTIFEKGNLGFNIEGGMPLTQGYRNNDDVYVAYKHYIQAGIDGSF
jgi:hypothetical protein